MADIDPPPSALGRPTRRLVPRTQREPQMLRVATRLFAEHGYGGVSMAQIAEAAGITKPMLYAYFDSKEGLYVACIERAAGGLLGALKSAVDPGRPPEQQLWTGLDALFAFIEENRDAWRSFLVDARAHGEAAARALRRLRDDLAEALTELLMRAAVDAGVSADIRAEVEIQARALIGSAEALADWWVSQGEGAERRELIALRLMNFAWMGLGDLVRGNVWLPPQPSTPRAEGPDRRGEGQGPPPSLDTGSVVASLRRLSDDELARGMTANREVILAEVFARMADYVDLDHVGDREIVIDWCITGSQAGDVDRWQLTAGREGARVERDGTRSATVTLELGPVELLRLVAGQRRGPDLYLSGRLRIWGDLLVASALPAIIGRPEPEAEV